VNALPVRALAVFAAFAVFAPACTDTSDGGDAEAPYDGTTESLPNGALEFGTGDFATTGTAGFPTANAPQAISLWVQYATGSGSQVFLSLRSDFASGVNLGIHDGQIAAWPVYPGPVLVATSTLPTAGAWHHVAFVLDRTDAGAPSETLYVDGVAAATATVAPDKLTPLASWIGSLDGTSDDFAGVMDEIRIWNVARTSAQIQDDMNGTTAADAPGLAAYFDCDSIHGTRVPDVSGNGNDATLGGGNPARMPSLVPSTVPRGSPDE
jgi:hypothetical protein